MKLPAYLAGIPEPAKGRKRSAGGASKQKVGEASKPAESKKQRVSPVVDVIPPASCIPPAPPATAPLVTAPPSKSIEVGPSSKKTTSVVTRPSSALPRSHLWGKGITEDVNMALLPPPRYQEPVPLQDVDIREVQHMGDTFLKGAGLTQTFLTLHLKYEQSVAELKRARSERDESLKQWRLASNEFQAREVQLEKVNFALKETQGILDAANRIIEGQKAALDSREEEVKALVAERDRLKAEGDQLKTESDKIKADAEASSTHLTGEITRLQNLLLYSVEEAFKNSLCQIQALNPGIELNVAGHHFRSYVEDDGKLVPYVEPPATSETRVDEDPTGVEVEQGEEASTVPAPTT